MHGKLHSLPLNITKVRLPRKPLRLSRLLLLACACLFTAQMLAGRDGALAVFAQSRLAPVLNQNSQIAIFDQYIVVFERGSTDLQVRAAEDIVKSHRGAILFRKPLTSAFHYSPLRLP